ncbi:MAG: hypothetical protein QNJ70_27560 [Xenococcaceae cyanobacterium MO_207.B15]|nr:hypothetical protein [Xenococcaceae cyanobacterium MO_207.B15]
MKGKHISARLVAKRELNSKDVYLFFEFLNEGYSVKWLPVGVPIQFWRTKDDKLSIELINYFGWKTLKEANEFCYNYFHHLPDTQAIIAQKLVQAGFKQGEIIFDFNQRRFVANIFPYSLSTHADVYLTRSFGDCDLLFYFIYGAYHTTCAQILKLENWRSSSLFRDFNWDSKRRTIDISKQDIINYLEKKHILPSFYRSDHKEQDNEEAFYMLKNGVFRSCYWDN